MDGSDSSAVFPTSQSDIDLNWDASIRARAGVAFNRFLVYATGGAAYVDVDIDGGPLGGPFGSLDENDNEWGWTVGGGAEWAITNNIIIGAEYRFTDYGDISGDLAPPFPTVTESVDLSTHAVRGRVSFKFNGLGP